MTELVLDDVQLQASIESAVSGALVFADKMADAIRDGNLVELAVMAGQYRELRRVMRQLKALRAELAA